MNERIERIIALTRRCTPSDQAALRRFQSRCFGPQARQLEAARFRWIFEENPAARPGDPEVWVHGTDEINGQQSGIPFRLKIDREEHPAIWSIDLMVDPEWRLRGIGPALIERLARSHPITVALGASDLLYPTLRHFGWRDLGHVPCFVRPLDAGRLGPWWRRRGQQARVAARLATPALRLLDLRNDWQTRGHTLQPIERFDANADQLWARIAPRYPILARRDLTALAWRFDRSPDAGLYRRFYLRRREDIVGYLVLRDGVLLDAPVCFIADYFCAPEQTTPLLNLVVRSALRTGAGAIVLDTQNRFGHAAIRQAGFFAIHKRGPRRFLWRTQPHLEQLHPRLGELGNWFITRADSDWDHPNAAAELEAMSSGDAVPPARSAAGPP